MAYVDYRMHGTTPTGRSRSYSYYATTERVNGSRYHVRCEIVHSQLPELLARIRISPKHFPAIQEIYTEHLKSLKGPNIDQRLAELKASAKRIQAEGADYARLFAKKKLSEPNYDMLHKEGQISLAKVNQEIRQIEDGHVVLLDGLEQALLIISKAYAIYEKLNETQQARLLQIIFQRIIIGTEGQIVDFSLNPPFEYLSSISCSIEDEGVLPRVDGSNIRSTPSFT